MMFTFSAITQHAQNICITFIQRQLNVFDVGPTLYKCYTNVCACWVTLIFFSRPKKKTWNWRKTFFRVIMLRLCVSLPYLGTWSSEKCSNNAGCDGIWIPFSDSADPKCCTTVLEGGPILIKRRPIFLYVAWRSPCLLGGPIMTPRAK